MLHPLFERLVPGVDPMDWLLGLNLAAAILGVELERRSWSLLWLVAAFVLARLALPVIDARVLLPISEALWALACLLAIAYTVRHALQPGRVDAERIFAALDAYLLAAVMFAVGYFVMDREWPGSFAQASGGSLSRAESVYLSLVTITTLGLGDIVPVGDTARGLMTVEAVGGQMYLAVLVARLVSLYARKEA